MPARRVVRPIVRSFSGRFSRLAADYVKEGGHAVVWETKARGTLVLPVPRKGDEDDLGYWALLDLGKSTFKVEKKGAFRGLVTLRLPRDCHDIVRGWARRDAVHPGPKRTMLLDCLACGACCRDNKVILEDKDIERFEAAGRKELAAPPFARKKDGTIVLVLLRNRDCKHLGGDNRCGIYELRPEACRTFPMASECCLFAREEELGIIDGDA